MAFSIALCQFAHGQDTAQDFFQRGLARLKSFDYVGATDDFTRVIELEPENADAFYHRALARQQNPSRYGAVLDVRRALELNPRLEDALLWSMRENLRSSDFDGAILDATRGIELNSKNQPSFYFERAQAKQAQGNIGGAIEDWTNGMALERDNYNSYEYRAVLFYSKGAWKEALADLLRARPELHRHSREKVHFHIWVLRMKLGEKDEADRELIAYLEGKRQQTGGEDWMGKVGGFLLGRMPESAFFPMKDPRLQQLRSWPLEAQQSTEWYFIGMKRLFAGDRAGAIEAFKKSAPGERGLAQDEYPFAKAELKALGQ